MERRCTSESLPRAAFGCGDSPPRGGLHHEQASRAARSAPFLAFDLRDPRLHHFFNKCGRQWLVRGELDGPFGCDEALKFTLELLDHRRSREQTAVVRKRREPHQHSFVLERRHPIADCLGSLGWHSGPNRRANLVQAATGGFRDASKIFINILRSAAAVRRKTTIAGFPSLHAGNSKRTSASSPCPRPPLSRSDFLVNNNCLPPPVFL